MRSRTFGVQTSYLILTRHNSRCRYLKEIISGGVFFSYLRLNGDQWSRGETSSCLSLPSGRSPEKKGGGAACFQGLCPVAMANAVNGTTPTSQLQFAPSFRSVPKGSLGPCARPSGQIMGGERRGQLGAKERRLKNGSLSRLRSQRAALHLLVG